MKFIKILKHGSMYGRKVVFTCKKCGCQFEIPATKMNWGEELEWIIFSHICPECGSWVRVSNLYKDWFKED